MGRKWVYSASSKAAALGLLAVVALWGSVTPAAAAKRLVGNSYVVYISKDGGNALLISAPKRVAKASHDGSADATAAGVAVVANPLTDRYWGANGYARYNGAYVQSQFNDHASGGCGWWTCDDYIDGNSHVWWWGASPYYATQMRLTDYIWEDGCVMSVQIPGGVGFSVVTTSSVSWDTGWVGSNDIWYINHYYSGIHFSTGCGRWNLGQDTHGDARFGYNYYSPESYATTTPP